MGLIALDPNQGTIYRQGCWLWRVAIALDTAAATVNAARNALFRVPTGTRILGGLIDVTTADGGTTLTCDISLENEGGDVDLDTGIDLTTAAKSVMDTADEGVLSAHDSSGTPVDVVMDIASSTDPDEAGVFTAGLFAARVDYDKEN